MRGHCAFSFLSCILCLLKCCYAFSNSANRSFTPLSSFSRCSLYCSSHFIFLALCCSFRLLTSSFVRNLRLPKCRCPTKGSQQILSWFSFINFHLCYFFRILPHGNFYMLLFGNYVMVMSVKAWNLNGNLWKTEK